MRCVDFGLGPFETPDIGKEGTDRMINPCSIADLLIYYIDAQQILTAAGPYMAEQAVGSLKQLLACDDGPVQYGQHQPAAS